MAQNISDIRKQWFIEQVEKLKDSGMTYAEIAGRLSVLPQFLNNILKGNRAASEKFVSKFCEEFNVNQNDLFNRQKVYSGEVIEKTVVSQPKYRNIEQNPDITPIGIPLIPIEAVAGFLLKGDISVMEYEVKDPYSVPEFNARGVKYLIRVSGSSMYPKYSNGDILACRPITDITFFQWGKVYVLDTDQGALVKRLFEGKDDTCIECRSDNKEYYPAFQINKLSIRTVSIVVGVIRLD